MSIYTKYYTKLEITEACATCARALRGTWVQTTEELTEILRSHVINLLCEAGDNDEPRPELEDLLLAAHAMVCVAARENERLARARRMPVDV